MGIKSILWILAILKGGLCVTVCVCGGGGSLATETYNITQDMK